MNEECVEINAAFLRHLCDTEELAGVTMLEMELDAEEQRVEAIGEFLPNLESLKLNNSVIPCVRDLGVKFENVKFLWLNRCQLVELDGIGCLPVLEELYVAFNEISELAPLQFHETLQVLDLEGNQVKDLSEIENLQSCYMLSELSIEDNPICRQYKNQSKLKREIRKAVPQLKLLNSMDCEGSMEIDGEASDADINSSVGTPSVGGSSTKKKGSTPGSTTKNRELELGGMELLGEDFFEEPDPLGEDFLQRTLSRIDEEHDDDNLKAETEKSTQNLLAKLRNLEKRSEDKQKAVAERTEDPKAIQDASRQPSVPTIKEGEVYYAQSITSLRQPRTEAEVHSFQILPKLGQEPDEHELIVEALKATRANFWRNRWKASDDVLGIRRPMTSYSVGSSAGSTASYWSKLDRPLTCSTMVGDDQDRVSTAVSASSVSSELTQGDEALVGSNPLRAIRQRRKNLNLAEKHNESISEMIAKFRNQSSISEGEIARRRKQLQENGMRPKTADVRISAATSISFGGGSGGSSSSSKASGGFSLSSGGVGKTSTGGGDGVLRNSGSIIEATKSGDSQIQSPKELRGPSDSQLAAEELPRRSGMGARSRSRSGSCSECTTAQDDEEGRFGLSSDPSSSSVDPVAMGDVHVLDEKARGANGNRVSHGSHGAVGTRLGMKPMGKIDDLLTRPNSSKGSTLVPGFSPPKPRAQKQKQGSGIPLPGRRYSKDPRYLAPPLAPVETPIALDDDEEEELIPSPLDCPTKVTKRGEFLVLS